jgi:U3 small nucleolar RNA-associated protein 23
MRRRHHQKKSEKMRHLRAKQGRKTLAYFRISFGIAPPYSVLVDGNFIHTACSFKIDILARIKKHIGDKFQLFVPSSVVAELKALGKAFEPALEFVQTYCEVAKGDGGVFETPNEEIKALIGKTNASKYLVATQESELRDYLRSNIPGVPLLHIQRTVLLLESPSSNSRHASSSAESDKVKKFAAAEAETLAVARKVRLQERAEKRRQDGQAAAVPKKTKAKGPNPLSCMKKKTETQPKPVDKKEVIADDASAGKKRNRRRKKNDKQE